MGKRSRLLSSLRCLPHRWLWPTRRRRVALTAWLVLLRQPQSCHEVLWTLPPLLCERAVDRRAGAGVL